MDWTLGHGHVKPRPDGAKARCGGPALCTKCQAEKAAQYAEEMKSTKKLEIVMAQGYVVKPGDRLVVVMEEHITANDMHELLEHMRTQMPGIEVTVIAGGVKTVFVERDERPGQGQS